MSGGTKVVARGIVIRKMSAGEGSARVQLYTDAIGLVWAHVQSAREERSQLRPHIQVGTRGRFALVKGKDTWRLTGISHTTNLHYDLQDIEAQKTLQRVLVFIRQFVRGEGNDPYFFTVLWNFLEALSVCTKEALPDVEHAVILRMLASLGYVEDGERVAGFLTYSYEPAVLSHFQKERKAVLHTINEGIAASGLT